MDVASLLLKVGIKADTDALEKLQSKLESINSKLRILAGAEIIKGLFHLTENFGHSALELENTAAAAGLTTEAMQKLQFAVAQSGGNASELGMTMSHLARLIEGARLGADDAVQTFYKLGISQQAIQSYHNTEDALFGVMDALRQIKDPIKQHALLDQALGQGSRGLGRFALAGSAAARETTRNAKAMGAIVPAGTIRQLANAKAALAGFGQIVKAVSATVGGLFAPVVIKVVGAIEKFYSANRVLISQTLEDWVVNAAGALGYLVGLFETVGGAVFRFAARHSELLKTVMKGVLAFAAASAAIGAVAKAIGLVQSVWSGVAGIFVAAPYLAMAGALALVVASLHDVWSVLTGGKFADTWLYQAVTGTGAIGAAIQGAIGAAVGTIDSFGFGKIGPDVADHPMVRGFAAQNVVNNMSANIPPPMIAAPSVANSNSQANVNVSSNVTVNVPAGMTASDAKAAVADGVRTHMDQSLAQALQRFPAAHLY